MNRVQDLTDMILEVLENHAGFTDWLDSKEDPEIEKMCNDIDKAIETWMSFDEAYVMDEDEE